MTAKEFNECVDLYADHLYRFILKTVRDKDKANDIVQDTYEKLWLKVSDVESTNAKSYMFTTAYRTMIDFLRKEKKQTQLEEHHTEGLQSRNSGFELKQVIQQALDRLPEIQKTVVMLRDYEGYNYDEIGKITGLNESQVKVYIYRARIAMKESIGSIDRVA
jgi:RNA polymerase sigma factor (sigma-70 family)